MIDTLPLGDAHEKNRRASKSECRKTSRIAGQPDLLPGTTKTRNLPARAAALAVVATTVIISSGHRLGLVYGQRAAVEICAVER